MLTVAVTDLGVFILRVYFYHTRDLAPTEYLISTVHELAYIVILKQLPRYKTFLELYLLFVLWPLLLTWFNFNLSMDK